jgi:Domain of unknown function (DUF4111)
VLIVARRRTSAAQRRALVEGLRTRSGVYPPRGPARPVELTVLVQSDVRPWRYPPRCEFQYGEWLRDECERGATPAPRPDPDLAPLLTMVLLGNSPLCGPPPAEVLDPVPPEDLRCALVACVPGLLADLERVTRNVVLTLARIWTTLATAAIRSKEAAADWALPRLPAAQRPVLARARAVFLGAEAERWDDLLPRVRPHADHVVGEIERLATGGA